MSSPIFIKQCARLADPLLFIFNLSLSTGIFPTRWKPSYVIPIFKTGSRNNIEHYRDIAVLSALSKLFESLVTSYLTSQLSSVISTNQHGFMKGRSSSTNLIEFVNFSVGKIKKYTQVDAVYIDIRKAFDSLCHLILLMKLRQIGVQSHLLSWIESYLSDRKQFVRMSSLVSKPINVTSGVPQGSHLGPLLFILFVNDIPDNLRFSNCLMDADDLKIYLDVQSSLKSLNLQCDLDTLALWYQQKSLKSLLEHK